jgi:uncharacterized protein
MLYLESNIFIYAAVDNTETGNKARTLLLKIQCGQEKASTSALTFDEVFWAIKKQNPKQAIEAVEALLNFPNLDLKPVNAELLSLTLQIIKQYHLDPRDAIHAATAITTKADCIVSTDPHFDKLKEILRKTL